ncbi:hypothetical protein Cyast_1984 [Cyanobacterium stanieri PCC 7202]|uniref:Glycosyltransferase family 1 protein n=1 Tax=Cyanobacterium stanieri (strain ATCC 29140 / PCC 7202) TaxID=292563 RepID=K9YNA5_CYASC|nr:hypothetical protein Cyast_1984 [Cyanobacterium stanieri PCC 7202]
MIKVLLVRDYNACNTAYVVYCLNYLRKRLLIKFREINILDYLDFSHDSYDVVIYATHPGEDTNKFKRILSTIVRTDDKFLAFPKTKILFDGHAHGAIDGFSRLRGTKLPRIKNAPHKKILSDLNVILPTTHPMGIRPKSPVYNYFGPIKLFPKSVVRDIDISYRVNLGKNDNYRRQIRQAVLNKIQDYHGSNLIDTKFVPKDPNYKNYMSRVLISVCPPGHGPGSFRHLESLNAKSLMFSHDSINDVQLLPNTDLIDGEDYISFNLDNIHEKLDQLLDDRDRIEKIAEKGYRKFVTGYSIAKTAQTIFDGIKKVR